MLEAGVCKALFLSITTCFKKSKIDGLEEVFSTLRLIPIPSKESKVLLVENYQIIESLTWVLGCNLDNNNHSIVQSHAVSVLQMLLEEASSSLLERLKPEFFQRIVGVIKENKKITRQGTNAALQVLLNASPCGRNRIIMVEYDAVFELKWRSPEKKTTEMITGMLIHLCPYAEGRAKFFNHRGGIAVVANRILNVSPVVDDRAVLILALICKYSGIIMVLQEMLNVKAVSKLCMMLQADCAIYLKEKAREILRSHPNEWKKKPLVLIFEFIC